MIQYSMSVINCLYLSINNMTSKSHETHHHNSGRLCRASSTISELGQSKAILLILEERVKRMIRRWSYDLMTLYPKWLHFLLYDTPKPQIVRTKFVAWLYDILPIVLFVDFALQRALHRQNQQIRSAEWELISHNIANNSNRFSCPG